MYDLSCLSSIHSDAIPLQLLDSSNMETRDWLRLVADIDLNYQSFVSLVSIITAEII